MRIEHNGDFEFCRWSRKIPGSEKYNISDTDPIEYFQTHMSSIRKQLLNAKEFPQCKSCHVMEKHNKVSGRQKQLLKIGVLQGNFAKSFLSSPLLDDIKYSNDNSGKTNLLPVDWQIDLGNFCNSSCIMCLPKYSSKLANEWYQLGLIDEPHDNTSWAQNDKLLEKFLDSLTQIKNLQFLQFLGGETLITPAFKKILQELISKGLTSNLIIGFTTNLTVWPVETIDLLKKFKNVHIGLSIETLNNLNDYIRWPSKISVIKENLSKFIQLSSNRDWFVSLRVTPNLFSVLYIDEIYRFALDKNLGVESCNFIYSPEYLKLDLLPKDLRISAINKLKKILSENTQIEQSEPIFNVRQKNIVKQTILDDIKSVINYLQRTPIEETQYDNLVVFLKKIEKKRTNKIINYAPEYENFLRTIGY